MTKLSDTFDWRTPAGHIQSTDVFSAPKDDESELQVVRRKAAELLKRFTALDQRLSTAQSNALVTIHFPEQRSDVCDHCRELDGKTFVKSDFPRLWPFWGCQNDIGCLPELSFGSEEGRMRELDCTLREGEIEESEKADHENSPSLEDPLGLLSQLKVMLLAGLISPQDYGDKKKEILSRM